MTLVARLLDRRGRSASNLVMALVALKVVLLFLVAFNRRIVMDEFAQLGWARYLGHGFFDTIWPAKAVGFQLFIWPAHQIGWDAQSILATGRFQMALLACATLAIFYICARSLSLSSLRAALAILILLSFSNFFERIFETRAEPLALFFAAAALLVVLRGRAPRYVVVAGLLSGLAFLTTQKAVYFNVALGLALVGDAAIRRRYLEGIVRGAWLVAGWLASVAAYCLIFGGTNPLPIVQHLFVGPAPVMSAQISAEYGGLRRYVVQTLARNSLLYMFCFAGMALAFMRLRKLDEPTRVALIFSTVITLLVFTHDQPWPYVFIMALPFLALWALEPFDALRNRPPLILALGGMLAIAVLASFVKNIAYLKTDNRDQLDVVARAEALLGPADVYFDGVGMLPNRSEPSTLWLDRHSILRTVREGTQSEAYRIFAAHPPKLIIWTYRMDGIDQVVSPLIRNSYVQVAPNIRMSGVRLVRGRATLFDVPIAGRYALYTDTGRPAPGALTVEGRSAGRGANLPPGPIRVTLRGPTDRALLVPIGDYSGLFAPGVDDTRLFEGVYD